MKSPFLAIWKADFENPSVEHSGCWVPCPNMATWFSKLNMTSNNSSEETQHFVQKYSEDVPTICLGHVGGSWYWHARPLARQLETGGWRASVFVGTCGVKEIHRKLYNLWWSIVKFDGLGRLLSMWFILYRYLLIMRCFPNFAWHPMEEHFCRPQHNAGEISHAYKKAYAFPSKNNMETTFPAQTGGFYRWVFLIQKGTYFFGSHVGSTDGFTGVIWPGGFLQVLLNACNHRISDGFSLYGCFQK